MINWLKEKARAAKNWITENPWKALAIAGGVVTAFAGVYYLISRDENNGIVISRIDDSIDMGLEKICTAAELPAIDECESISEDAIDYWTSFRRQHFRYLGPNGNASYEKLQQAKLLNIDLPDHTTIVDACEVRHQINAA